MNPINPPIGGYKPNLTTKPRIFCGFCGCVLKENNPCPCIKDLKSMAFWGIVTIIFSIVSVIAIKIIELSQL